MTSLTMSRLFLFVSFFSSLPFFRRDDLMLWRRNDPFASARRTWAIKRRAHDSRSLADGALPSWTVAHDRLSVPLIQNVKRRDKEAEREREKSGLFRRTTGKRKQTCPSTLRLGVHLDEKLWVGQFLLTISKTALGFMMNVVCGVLSVYSSRVFISACWIGEGGMERVRGEGGGLRLPNVLSPNAAGLARFFLDTPRCSAINWP